MPSKHKHQPIAFRPPEGDRVWLLDHARATGQPVNRILAAALAEYRDRRFICCETQMEWPAVGRDRTCPDCGTVWEREPVNLGAGARIKAPAAEDDTRNQPAKDRTTGER